MKIFVGHVVAARKSDLSVDDRDLPVVAVVLECLKNRKYRIEHAALNALGNELLPKIAVDKDDAPEVVIDEADLDALRRLLTQNLMDLLKCESVLNRVILHKNERLRISQRFLLRLERRHGIRIKGDLRIPIDRVALRVPAVCLYVPRHARKRRVFLLNLPDQPRAVRQGRQQDVVDLGVPALHFL